MCGATGCLDGLAYVLCDSDDVAITPTPVYSRIQMDFLAVANVKVEPLELLDEVSNEDAFQALHSVSLQIEAWTHFHLAGGGQFLKIFSF